LSARYFRAYIRRVSGKASVALVAELDELADAAAAAARAEAVGASDAAAHRSAQRLAWKVTAESGLCRQSLALSLLRDAKAADARAPPVTREETSTSAPPSVALRVEAMQLFDRACATYSAITDARAASGDPEMPYSLFQQLIAAKIAADSFSIVPPAMGGLSVAACLSRWAPANWDDVGSTGIEARLRAAVKTFLEGNEVTYHAPRCMRFAKYAHELCALHAMCSLRTTPTHVTTSVTLCKRARSSLCPLPPLLQKPLLRPPPQRRLLSVPPLPFTKSLWRTTREARKFAGDLPTLACKLSPSCVCRRYRVGKGASIHCSERSRCWGGFSALVL
jgi:hypothetical protein